MGITYEEFLQDYADDTMIKRLNTVEEVAALALLLASQYGGGHHRCHPRRRRRQLQLLTESAAQNALRPRPGAFLCRGGTGVTAARSVAQQPID